MSKLFTFVVAIAMVAGIQSAQAGKEPVSDPRLCARFMCDQMRSCSLVVPQPTPTNDKVEKPSGRGVNTITTAKGSDKAQGFTEEPGGPSCLEYALMGFYDCSGWEPPFPPVPEVVEKPSSSKKAVDTKVVAPSPNNK